MVVVFVSVLLPLLTLFVHMTFTGAEAADMLLGRQQCCTVTHQTAHHTSWIIQLMPGKPLTMLIIVAADGMQPFGCLQKIS